MSEFFPLPDLEFKEVAVIDPSDIERSAMKQCLKFFGEAAGEIGITKALGDYSEAHALAVIEAIVTGYTEAMVAHHETRKYPPVRGLPPTPDPMNANTMEIYAELIAFDAALAQRMSDRAARRIIATEASELLPRAFADTTHFEYRFCAYAQRCRNASENTRTGAPS